MVLAVSRKRKMKLTFGRENVKNDRKSGNDVY